MAFESELAVALEAAALAATFIRAEYETFVPIPHAPATISTHVDRGSQDIILNHIVRYFPQDGICAEEDTATKQTRANRMWVVDPIDGTRGFVTKNGEFSIMIGLTIAGKPVVGVVLEPITMTWTYASIGQGCWTRIDDGELRRCHVSDVAKPSDCLLIQSHTRRSESPNAVVKALQPARLHEMYSAGVKLAVVARGDGDVYVNTYSKFHDWDICAGHILVEEAGGTVTGCKGEPIVYGNSDYSQHVGLIAANRELQIAVVAGLSI